ncbi:carboxypeptidase-like regulatory domain-containing protein [Mucilaginibacter gotjawali]|uniref:TonB-dependent SusC/RagA subfamily outer membrane receptor n=2 Tax=Mucilaginibacter gotjawali TaxID=1550579 RepID=A0A839SKL8_9SPHI|nr:TonB-dependent receptor plug domain-containing protein [Mucilaginibacter gotjawali]MBB3057794.1 TonB-dependent SusC/RagA subfamily outer membrane receptor [Mucilaginibacter gotjawali]BAU52596.1 MG2 domain protein [Mucilaginibacter gotjawali]
MKHLSFIFRLIFIGGWCCSFAYGQNISPSQTITARLTAFSVGQPAEKAYLQLDKPYYAAGDTIYFKAYVTAGEQHMLSSLSGVLHVDLIGTKDKISQSIKLQLDSGIAWGDFALPDSLPAGNYRIRAYTQWMRNNADFGFFEKEIPIGSVKAAGIPESLSKNSAPANMKPDIQFFPEGGSLVAGILCKVAFKATGANGLGMDIKGRIVDNDNRRVAIFASSHLGMGYFYLEPAEDKTYSAEINYSDGRTGNVKLPTPEPNGLVLSVDNDSIPRASVSIKTSKTYFAENRNKVYTLLIYSGGLITTVNCRLDSPVIKLEILKRKLHTGVATITLFSSDNEPLCERLIYIQNYDRLSLNLRSDKNTYTKREKVNINLDALNRKGEPAEGHFSVSVIDESQLLQAEDNGDNILTDLLLTSDLKGYIEHPAYYFSGSDTLARKNLDVLLLTQGYRRFTWQQVLDTAKKERAYLPEKGIELSGQVKNPFNRPIANGTVTLIPSKGGGLLSTSSDDKGMFRFSNLVFTDTANFVLSAVNAKNKNTTKITWFDEAKYAPPVQKNLTGAYPVFNTTAMASYLANDKIRLADAVNFKGKGIQLKQVDIHEKKPDDPYRTFSLAGAGHADQVMHAEEIEKVQGPIGSSLNGRLRGVIFVGSNPMSQVAYLRTSLGPPMLLIIDGAEVPAGDINFLTPNDIETIEVLKYASSTIYGMSSGNGVLVITTKNTRKLDAKDIASIGVLPIAPMGFYKAREFYSPKYDNTTWVSKQKDLRSTIYWQPELKTNKEGNANFDFYNADGTGNYKIILEGIDKDGNIGRQEYTYKVE